jgi:hypothetical protein
MGAVTKLPGWGRKGRDDRLTRRHHAFGVTGFDTGTRGVNMEPGTWNSSQRLAGWPT